MKTYSALTLWVGCFLLNLVGTQSLKSDDVPPQQHTNLKLSGSELKVEDAVTKADAIFVGQVENIGSPSIKDAGGLTYHGVRVKVTQILKGSPESQIVVSLFVKDVVETPPEVGSSYIFFENKVPGWNIILKLIPATDDNLAKVKALISTTATSK